MKNFIVIFLFLTIFSGLTSSAQEKVTVYDIPQPPQNPNKPHAPARVNVEAWIDESILTITFLQPEGEATITFDSEYVYNQEELTFSTDAPFMIDITPYGEVSSFTIETEAGHTYIGYLNQF